MEVSCDEVRAIVREATVYGVPMVEHYRIQHAFYVDGAHPNHKGPWNRLAHTARINTPADATIQAPNADTLNSRLGADLRAEPLVLSIPPVKDGRYFSAQFIDAYTHNFAYAGSRTTGQGGGHFLLAGPNWTGEVPAGITQVMRSETSMAYVMIRTQLFHPDEIEEARRVQAGYEVWPLSDFLVHDSPRQPPAPAFVAPVHAPAARDDLRFFEVLNFMLGWCPVHPDDAALRARFARIGVGAGLPFDAAALAPERRQALRDGMADAWADFEALRRRAGAGEVQSGDVFGSREFLAGNHLYRMAGAVMGIYGNSREEAMYPYYGKDAEGQPLSGEHRYTMRFAPGQLPPTRSFWSLTLYREPEILFFANPLDRYLLNSPMLPRLVPDADGGYTFHIQADSPGPEREPNWLPAPRGPISLSLRLYWPEAGALEGRWTPPPLRRASQA